MIGIGKGYVDKAENLFWGLVYSSLGSKLAFLFTAIRHTVRYVLGVKLKPKEMKVILKGNVFVFKEFTGEIGMFNQIFVKKIYDSYPGFARVGKQNGIIFDVGANIGMFTLLVARQNPDCRVYSFEPNPDVYMRLTKNIEVNGLENVKPYRLGFSDKEAVAGIDDRESTVLGTIRFGDAGGLKRVELSTIDLFMKREGIKRIDLLKLDIEGFEYLALKGLEKNIRGVRRIVMEYSEELKVKVISHLEERGFENVKCLSKYNVVYFLNRQTTSLT